MIKIGVLALQGDFYLHAKRLRELEVEPVEVRKPEHLTGCRGLIIPGGESTTLEKLLKNTGLFEAIREFNRRAPVFGTCAGAILVGSEVKNHPVEPLNLIDITVVRNAYGRQIDSFVDMVEVELHGEPETVEGVFIRAPRIIRVGEGVRVIGRHREDIVLVETERVMAATFHPELTEDARIHRHFLEKVRRMNAGQ